MARAWALLDGCDHFLPNDVAGLRVATHEFSSPTFPALAAFPRG